MSERDRRGVRLSGSHNGGPLAARVAGELIDALERATDELAPRMTASVRTEIPEYAAPPAAALAPQIESHCREHLAAFIGWARAGCRPDALDLGFVRERAAVRAAGPVPLGALLRSYLIGQREIWRTLTGAVGASDADAVRELTAATFEYTGMITAAVAEAYAAAGARLAAHAEYEKRDLLEALLAGNPVPDELVDLSAALGLPGPHGIAVAALRVIEDDSGAEAPTDALVGFLRGVLSSTTGAGGLASRRAVGAVALLPLASQGLGEARVLLEQALAAHDGGALAGIGFRAPDLAGIPAAHADAIRALRHATPERPVVALGDVRLVEHLAVGAEAGATRLVPPAVAELLDRDAASGGPLRETLTAFAGEGMNISRAASRLFVHANTVRYRLGRVRADTELDPTRFADLEELLAAIRLTPR